MTDRYPSRSFAAFAVKYFLLFFHHEEHEGTRKKTKKSICLVTKTRIHLLRLASQTPEF